MGIATDLGHGTRNTGAGRTTLPMLNLAAVESAPLHTEPFEYLVAEHALLPECRAALVEDFPQIERHGSFALSTLSYGPAFGQLVDELLGKDFERAIGRKFSLNLGDYPTMITVRGRCSGAGDGQIHTDSKEKLITVLLYLNPEWESSGGRLRLLRSKNLEDLVAEVPPTFGSLLVFRRCDHSWHGHRPFDGKRMSLQMNWVTSGRYLQREQLRHKISSLFKWGR